MSQDRNERYASAAQILEDLAAQPQSAPARWKPLTAAAVILAAAAFIAAAIILEIRHTNGKTEEISLDNVERIVIVPTEGKVQVEKVLAKTADLKDWLAQPSGREVVIRDNKDGSVTITNPREEFDWVMAYSTAKLSSRKPRYLYFDIVELGGSNEAGWYVKMAPDGFGGEEVHIASGRDTGKFVVAMPQSILTSKRDRWAVQMFSTGPEGSQVRFRDVKFVDNVPDGVDTVLAVP